jgi:hypothetical protein
MGQISAFLHAPKHARHQPAQKAEGWMIEACLKVKLTHQFGAAPWRPMQRAQATISPQFLRQWTV